MCIPGAPWNYSAHRIQRLVVWNITNYLFNTNCYSRIIRIIRIIRIVNREAKNTECSYFVITYSSTRVKKSVINLLGWYRRYPPPVMYTVLYVYMHYPRILAYSIIAWLFHFFSHCFVHIFVISFVLLRASLSATASCAYLFRPVWPNKLSHRQPSILRRTRSSGPGSEPERFSYTTREPTSSQRPQRVARRAHTSWGTTQQTHYESFAFLKFWFVERKCAAKNLIKNWTIFSKFILNCTTLIYFLIIV